MTTEAEIDAVLAAMGEDKRINRGQHQAEVDTALAAVMRSVTLRSISKALEAERAKANPTSAATLSVYNQRTLWKGEAPQRRKKERENAMPQEAEFIEKGVRPPMGADFQPKGVAYPGPIAPAPDRAFLFVSLILNGALYLTGVFAIGLIVDNKPAWTFALATVGVCYLCAVMQTLLPAWRIAAAALFALSLITGLAAGLALFT
jgi:hypothetical protein